MSDFINEQYDSGITDERWLELLEDRTIFNYEVMCVLKRFLETGDSSCKELAKKYNGNADSYSGRITPLCSQLFKITKAPFPKDTKNHSTWSILFSWREIEKKENLEGSFIFRLRPALKSALEKMQAEGKLDIYKVHEKPLDWIPFFEEFSRILNTYSDKQPELINKLKHLQAC